MCQLKENCTQIGGVRVPRRKHKQEHQSVNNIFSHFNSDIRYFRYINGYLPSRKTRHGHIRYQRLKINQNRRFVFKFSHILVLTVFRYFFRTPYWIKI